VNELEPFDLSQEVVEIATDRLAENIVLLDLQEEAILTDYFVIMTCNSARHIEALSYDLEMLLDQKGGNLLHREGVPISGWVVLDYGAVVVHLFHEEQRDYYNLEQIWSRGSQVVRIL
tara:strand:+ start:582 stop:935 length:354 start_codon:yes stop_codon:yes gene_type:complete